MSQGCVIVKLPKQASLPIYYKKDEIFYILPEYIYGHIEVEDKQIKTFTKNPFYTDIHDYDSNGLFYDTILTSNEYNYTQKSK